MEKQRSSKRQRELLNFVDSFIQGHGYGPSYREIMRALGYKSVSTVAVHIDGLINRGYLRKGPDNSARSLEVITTRLSESPVKTVATPAQEKWLVSAINDKFETLDESQNQEILDEIYVLIGALKILGLDGAHVAMKTRLTEYLKSHNKANS